MAICIGQSGFSVNLSGKGEGTSAPLAQLARCCF